MDDNAAHNYFLANYEDFVAECPQPDGAPILDEQFMKGYWAASQFVSEAGEVLELFEKSYRKGHALDLRHLEDELGDALWGLTCIANTYGISLEDVILTNMQKLGKRNSVIATKD